MRVVAVIRAPDPEVEKRNAERAKASFKKEARKKRPNNRGKRTSLLQIQEMKMIDRNRTQAKLAAESRRRNYPTLAGSKWPGLGVQALDPARLHHQQQDLQPPRHQHAPCQKMKCLPIQLGVPAPVPVSRHHQQQDLPPPLHQQVTCQKMKCIPIQYPKKFKLNIVSEIRVQSSHSLCFIGILIPCL